VSRFIDIPHGVGRFIVKNKAANIKNYRSMEGIGIIKLEDERLRIEGEKDAVDLVIVGVLNLIEKSLKFLSFKLHAVDINEDSQKEFVSQLIDTPYEVVKFIIGTKGANIKNYQSMEGIKNVYLKDDRLRITGERDAVDLVIACVLNLVEKSLENLRRQAQKDLQSSFGKVMEKPLPKTLVYIYT